MATEKLTVENFKSVSSPKRKNTSTSGYKSIKSSKRTNTGNQADQKGEVNRSDKLTEELLEAGVATGVTARSENKDDFNKADAEFEPNFAEARRLSKEKRKWQKFEKLIDSENWVIRNGHTITFAGVYLFTFFVFFRPYELISGLEFLTFGTFVIAATTVGIYILTQVSTERNISVFPTEIKCVLGLVVLGLITIPIARDPGVAWETFNDIFIKAVLIFIVMVNVVRTKNRLMAIIWLSISIGIYLSYSAIERFATGQFTVEGYRVDANVEGLFGNPNDMSLHLTTLIPIVLILLILSKSKLAKLFYFALALLFVGGIFVSYSRGAFLGLIVSMTVFAFKIGKQNRTKVSLAFAAVMCILLLFAPADYSVRIISIFIPSLDPVGSSTARKENLLLSLLASARNPWGLGMGNSITFGVGNLQTHNSYTQVSSELGITGLIVYLVFLISPFRKLGAIERRLYAEKELNWFYYLSIGLQTSIIAFMVTSFFASIAYHWFVYYIIAYAVVFRRIYRSDTESR